MRLVATTVVRESIRGKQRTGYIYDVDWDRETIARRLPVPEPSFPESDDNPRGGVRGGRGVAVTRHGIVVANYDTLYLYDDDWNVVSSFSHPLFVGLHEVDWDGQHLWAAATGLDLVVKVDLAGSAEAAWDPHGSPALARFGIGTRTDAVDGSVDYRVREAPLLNKCHVNGVTRAGDRLVVNCGLVRRQKPLAIRTFRRLVRKLGRERSDSGPRHSGPRHSAQSLVIGVDPDRSGTVLVELGEHDFPTHNGQMLDENRVAVNDSTHNTLRVFSLDGAVQEVAAIGVSGTWLRGLEPVSSHQVVVGSAPASLLLVDLEERRVVRQIALSEDPNEAVHGLAVCPPVHERR